MNKKELMDLLDTKLDPVYDYCLSRDHNNTKKMKDDDVIEIWVNNGN